MRALIVEHGRNRGVLAAARSLSRAGWRVGLCSNNRYSIAGASRAVDLVHRLGCDPRDSGAVVETIKRTIADDAYDVVFPADESLLLALSERRNELDAVFPFAPHDVLLQVLDRYELARLAQAAGLGTPTTQLCTREALDGLPNYAVVKSRRYLMVPGAAGVGRVEALVGTPEEVRRWVAEIELAGGEAVVQELVSGQLGSLTILMAPDGSVIAKEQQQAERLWPPEAGVSVRARTCGLDRDLCQKAVAMLRNVGWHGLVQLQFIVPPSGEPQLIDFNPRYYGSLALAIAAGTDLPALWAELAADRETAQTVARPHLRYHWLGGDLRRAARERRGYLVGDLTSCLAFSIGAVHPAWSWHDPLPALLSGWLVVARRSRRRSPGHG
jgi:predicted ATP-grasp superfamily ATP-dependent carboligase